ncbi:hypothetical protein QCA50_008108 [Cerrena zonata]|uniref:Uncharacterized protein n=1 Tax=Cerrena zonata TaxID=2478898 RepID=A0AAW0GHZ6_9APHY
MSEVERRPIRVGAIALSIQDAKVPNAPKVSQPGTGPRDIIEILSSDQEDLPDEDDTFKAEIRRAIEASKAPSAVVKTEEPKNTVKTESGIPTTPLANITPVAQSTFPFDRAQLERDRLARLKRLRPDLAEAQSSSGTKNEDSDNEDDRERDSKRQRVSNSSSAIRRSDLSSSTASSSTSQSPNTENIFWSGELRQTANKHVDKLKDIRPIFTLTDTLAPRDEISFAILSAYCIDFPWIYSLLNPTTPVIVVAQDPQGRETLKEVLPNWIKTTPMLRGGRGCMHMKVLQNECLHRCH